MDLGTDADYATGKQDALNGHRVPVLKKNSRYLDGFTYGRQLFREANATANHPIPDSDNMGAPRRPMKEKSS
jgi:hypothetical protein